MLLIFAIAVVAALIANATGALDDTPPADPTDDKDQP